MFRVVSGFCEEANGTSRVGQMDIAPSQLILAFGQPGESDGHKVSGEYTFVHDESGVVFTIYDWKSTSLYDGYGPSPEAFWAGTEAVQMNIGGNDAARGLVHEFIAKVIAHVKYVETGKPFEQVVLGQTTGSGLFLPGK